MLYFGKRIYFRNKHYKLLTHKPSYSTGFRSDALHKRSVCSGKSKQHTLVHHFLLLTQKGVDRSRIYSFSSSVKLYIMYIFIVAQSEVTEIITPDQK